MMAGGEEREEVGGSGQVEEKGRERREERENKNK